MEKLGQKSKYEGAKEICMRYGYYCSLASKKNLIGRIRMRFDKDVNQYKKIEAILQRLELPASTYFDILFGSPIDIRKKLPWRYPYLSYLGSDTGMYVFQARLNEYKKQIGIYDDMLKYIRECSVANIEAWFDGSFWEGFFSLHRALDRLDKVFELQLFQIFAEDPVFTPIFIVTHGNWKRFSVRNIKNPLVKELKVRCKGELNLLSDEFIRERFLEARGRKRRAAQIGHVKSRDARWERVWKMLN